MSKDGRTSGGRFQKGTSGNPNGRRGKSDGAPADVQPPVTDPRFDVGDLLGNPGMLTKRAQLLPTRGAKGPLVNGVRKDDWKNVLTGQGVAGRDKRVGGFFAPITLSFDQLRDLWFGDDLAAVAVEMLPKEARRPGWDLTVTDADVDKEAADTDAEGADLGTQVKDVLHDLGADEHFEIAGQYARAYGGGAILLGVNDKQQDLTQPLDLNKVVSLDWLTTLEARECIPRWAYGDPRAPKYGQPEIYQLTSRTVLPSRTGAYGVTTVDVHESRLIIFDGIRVSRYQNTSARGGWGESVLTRVWRVLRDFNTAWSAAGVLVSDFAQTVIKMAGLWAALDQDGGQAFEDRLTAMDVGRSTLNAITIDAADSFERQQTPLTGLPDLLEKFAVRLAAACGMPLTLLFGTSPAGLNATGESDIRFFYDRVDEYRQKRLKPALRRLIQIIFRTLGNKREPAKWNLEFRPLWQESAKDMAAAMLTQAQADTAWITAGVLSPEEVAAAHWRGGKYNPHLSIDFDAREAALAAAAPPVLAPGPEDDEDPDPVPEGPTGGADPNDPRSPDGDPKRSPKADADDINRDDRGRFATGPGGDNARVERVRAEAADLARAQGHDATQAALHGAAEAGKEQQAIANERRAIAAGHITEAPTAKLEAYAATHGKVEREALQRQADLDEHQARAAQALADLRAHPEYDEHEIHDPTEAHENASEALGRVGGSEERHAGYDTTTSETHEPFRAQAEKTQQVLEQLHERQQQATAETGQAMRDHGRASRAMQRELENYENRGPAGDEDHPEHEAAREAVETLSGAEGTRRGDISSNMENRLEDAHGALREAAHETATTVRDLARVTGKSPRLAKKTDADDLSDDDLDQLAVLDGDDQRFDDGGWNEEDHPRAPDGKFGAGSGEGRTFFRGYDDREHQKVIEAHKQNEIVHREKSLSLKAEIHKTKARLKSASPAKQEAINAKLAKLTGQRATHQAAAAAAREGRIKERQAMTVARAVHSEKNLNAAAARAQAQRETIHTVGQRIGVGAGAEHAPAEPTAPVPHFAETPEHHFTIGLGETIRGEPETPHVESPLERLARQKQELRSGPAAPRSVVEYGHAAAENARARARESVAKERTAELNRQITAQHVTAKFVSLPEAKVHLPGVVARASASLRKMLGRTG